MFGKGQRRRTPFVEQHLREGLFERKRRRPSWILAPGPDLVGPDLPSSQSPRCRRACRPLFAGRLHCWTVSFLLLLIAFRKSTARCPRRRSSSAGYRRWRYFASWPDAKIHHPHRYCCNYRRRRRRRLGGRRPGTPRAAAAATAVVSPAGNG
jgi:hypothetical protein